MPSTAGTVATTALQRHVSTTVERAIPWFYSGPETLELPGTCNRLQPVMAVGRMQLSGGRRKVGVSEIADCDCQDRTTFEGPEHR